ncbi:hypothetical protein Plhal304r1_c014g0051141 [Plasmopara halstedii]
MTILATRPSLIFTPCNAHKLHIPSIIIFISFHHSLLELAPADRVLCDQDAGFKWIQLLDGVTHHSLSCQGIRATSRHDPHDRTLRR